MKSVSAVKIFHQIALDTGTFYASKLILGTSAIIHCIRGRDGRNLLHKFNYMKKTRVKAYAIVMLLAYVVVLGVNITNNYAYYKATGDWQRSVSFCLLATTLGCLGSIALYRLAIRRII